MSGQKIKEEIGKLQEEIVKSRKKINELRKKVSPENIKDYEFKDPKGRTVKLSEMFGDKDELIVIHNMGKSCPYCTLWADGFNGFYKHFENRAGFALTSPDSHEVLKDFSEGRTWKFKVYSTKENSFKKDLGFYTEEEKNIPGASTFLKDEKGNIFHYSSDRFGPGDDYCSIWHFFDMLPKGQNNWHPKFTY
jgi:predicted dithiol-disulfide oxidoreductase (DUF899 family)